MNQWNKVRQQVLGLVVGFLMIGVLGVNAQTANVTSIMGMNAQNIQNYEFNLGSSKLYFLLRKKGISL